MRETFSSPRTDVPDGLLQYASESDRNDVQEARAAHDEANDRLAAARRAQQDTEEQNKVLREQLALAEQQVDVERARIAARATGESTAVEAAEKQKVDAETRVEAARRELELNARRVTVRKAEVGVAEADVRVTERRIELAKARAVAPLDRPEVKDIDVEKFEADVRERETELALAKVEQEAAQREFEIYEKNDPDRE